MRILTSVCLLCSAANSPLNGWTLPLSNRAACRSAAHHAQRHHPR